MREPGPIVLLARRISGLQGSPRGRQRIEMEILARDAFDGDVISASFNKALAGSVEDAAALAAAVRPGWTCGFEKAQPQDGKPRVLARIVAPQPEDGKTPEAFSATREEGFPALALLDATLQGYADPNAAPPAMPFTWRDAVTGLIALVVIAAMLFFGAAFLQAMWEVFWEGWN
ncbi:MAG: hypothetical protein QM698_13755 [Micropepsaceae bacterium]